ncbi:MAG: hypothetical protein ACYC9P_10595, partial [Rudaea sp.]
MATIRTGRRRATAAFAFFSIYILALPLAAQTLTAPGLSAPGTIYYDALGTPTIKAQTSYDVAFLQGYA